MVSISRNLIEGKFAYDVGHCAITHCSASLQFNRRIIEESGLARQDLAGNRNPVIRFLRFDLHVNINVARMEQQLTRRKTDSTDSGKHWLIVGIEYQRGDEFPDSTSLGLPDRLEQIETPFEQLGWRLKGLVFLELTEERLHFLL